MGTGQGCNTFGGGSMVSGRLSRIALKPRLVRGSEQAVPCWIQDHSGPIKCAILNRLRNSLGRV
jgi:hypothetical protein